MGRGHGQLDFDRQDCFRSDDNANVSTCVVGYTIASCTATHQLTLYRASSGGLLFGAGGECRGDWTHPRDPRTPPTAQHAAGDRNLGHPARCRVRRTHGASRFTVACCMLLSVAFRGSRGCCPIPRPLHRARTEYQPPLDARYSVSCVRSRYNSQSCSHTHSNIQGVVRAKQSCRSKSHCPCPTSHSSQELQRAALHLARADLAMLVFRQNRIRPRPGTVRYSAENSRRQWPGKGFSGRPPSAGGLFESGGNPARRRPDRRVGGSITRSPASPCSRPTSGKRYSCRQCSAPSESSSKFRFR